MYSAFGVDHGGEISKGSFNDYRKTNRDYRKQKKAAHKEYLSKPGVAMAHGVVGAGVGAALAKPLAYRTANGYKLSSFGAPLRPNHRSFIGSFGSKYKGTPHADYASSVRRLTRRNLAVGVPLGAAIAYGSTKARANKSKNTTMN